MVALNFRDRSFPDLPGPLWLGQAAPLGWLALQRANGIKDRMPGWGSLFLEH